MAFIWCAVTAWVFPLQSRFYNSVKNTFRNALLCALAYLPRTLELAGFCRYFEADSPEGWDKVPFYAERTLRELSLIKDLVDRGEMEDEEL